jgi:hypothetical protein
MLSLQMHGQPTATYIVLSSVDSSDPYYEAVQILSEYRDAQVIGFDPENVDALLPVLIGTAPRYVAVAVKPLELHINFIREFLMMSTQLDDDPFSDFAYGYITGATAQDAVNFVNNIIYAESQNIENYPLKIGGYAASSLNFVFTVSGDYMQYLNPESYACIYMETNDNGSGRDFFLSNTNYMLLNKILDIGHNGDPHMLWLFEGGNINPDPPVWLYDPAKIEDTAYARVGLTSNDIGALSLYPAVAYNGACHAAETKTVMVEGDIAATFGDTQGLVKFYTMSDNFSYALQILKTGITGYFAPCGANNANDQSEDVYNTFLFDEPLGDIFKRSVDGVVMGFLGNQPNLRIFVENSSTYLCDILPSGTFDPEDWSGAWSMLGGKANRIYFGDPLFNPYNNNHADELNITTTIINPVSPNVIDVTVNFNKPDVYEAYFPVWDKFHFGNTRIYTPVDLPAEFAELTDFEVMDYSGVYDLVIHALEEFDGKKILHLEIDIPNDMYEEIDYSITFRINYTTTETEEYKSISSLDPFPNPAHDRTAISIPEGENGIYSLAVFDAQGKLVIKESGITTTKFYLDCKGFKPGLYFLQLSGKDGLISQGRIVIE